MTSFQGNASLHTSRILLPTIIWNATWGKDHSMYKYIFLYYIIYYTSLLFLTFSPHSICGVKILSYTDAWSKTVQLFFCLYFISNLNISSNKAVLVIPLFHIMTSCNRLLDIETYVHWGAVLPSFMFSIAVSCKFYFSTRKIHQDILHFPRASTWPMIPGDRGEVFSRFQQPIKQQHGHSRRLLSHLSY